MTTLEQRIKDMLDDGKLSTPMLGYSNVTQREPAHEALRDALCEIAKRIDALEEKAAVKQALSLKLSPAERDTMLARMHLLSPEEERRVRSRNAGLHNTAPSPAQRPGISARLQQIEHEIQKGIDARLGPDEMDALFKKRSLLLGEYDQTVGEEETPGVPTQEEYLDHVKWWADEFDADVETEDDDALELRAMPGDNTADLIERVHPWHTESRYTVRAMDDAGQETFKGHWYDAPDDAIREYTDEQWRKAQEREREEEIKRQEEREQRDDDAEVGRAIRELEPKKDDSEITLTVRINDRGLRRADIGVCKRGPGICFVARAGFPTILEAIKDYNS